MQKGGTCLSFAFALPGTGKKEKIRKGMTQSSAKAKSTPMMSIRIFSDTLGVQNITKQSWGGGRGKPGCEEKASMSGTRKPGILICRGAQREGDLSKQEAGIPVLKLPAPCPVLTAGTGPGPLATSAPQGPGQRGRCGRTEWGSGPLSGASGLPRKA